MSRIYERTTEFPTQRHVLPFHVNGDKLLVLIQHQPDETIQRIREACFFVLALLHKFGRRAIDS